MLGDKNKREGFTLVEILVVLGLFTLLGVLIINVFLLSLQAQRQASARQEAVSSIRFVLETMAQEIRTSEIAYPLDPSNQVLRLRSGAQYSLNTDKIILNVDGQIAALNDANEVTVIELHFFVDPPSDPFSEERCNTSADCFLPTSHNCTINDLTLQKEFKAGFCRCTTDSDCHPNVGNCNLDAGLCLPFDRQPRVTIVLAFQPVGQTGPESTPVYMQTTVSSRIYKR